MSTTAPAAAPAPLATIKGAVATLVVGLGVLAATLVGSQAELRHAFGTTGESGRVADVSCTDAFDDDLKDECTATFVPDGGGEERTVSLRGEYDGESFPARASGETAHRSDARAKITALAVPAMALAILAFVPYLFVTALVRRTSTAAFVVFAAAPAGLCLLVTVAGLVVA